MEGLERIPEELLRYEDVARLFGVAPQTVRSWVAQRRIPFVKLGVGRNAPVRFDPEQMRLFIAQWSRGAAVGAAIGSTLLLFGAGLTLQAANRSAIARLGGLARSSRYDGREMTERARSSFVARFEREVDPNGELPPAERERRARAALKLHMQRLALRSAQARRKGGAQ